MRILYETVAGLDVHKRTVVAAISIKQDGKNWRTEIRTFGTMTGDLLSLADWLLSSGVTHVAMESTGEYWKPIFNILEANFEVILVNAQHLSRVPGRKTDQSDAVWAVESQFHSPQRSARAAGISTLPDELCTRTGDIGKPGPEASGRGQYQVGQCGHGHHGCFWTSHVGSAC